MARIVQHIEVVKIVGDGISDNPVRPVFQLWTMDGVLVAECDPSGDAFYDPSGRDEPPPIAYSSHPTLGMGTRASVNK